MIDTQSLETRSGDAAKLLTAMGNQKRILILCNLTKGEMQVGALAEELQLSQSALSQHLAKLRHQGLVRTRREAQTVFYSISSKPVVRILQTLKDIFYV